VNRLIRWTAAFGAAVLLPLGPAAVATAAPAAGTASARTADRLVEVPASAALDPAVDPSECGATLFDAYFDEQISALAADPAVFQFVIDHQDTLFSVPTYDALFFGTAGDPTYALETHGTQVAHTFRDLRRFWDIDSSDIQLMEMNGESLLDADRIARTLTAMVATGEAAPMTEAEIQQEATTVATYLQSHGDLYDNPLWTANAFAFSAEGETDPLIKDLPDKLIMGKGIIEAYDSFGLGDVGPRVIMAHEFAHHVQYELNAFDNGPSDPAAATRRTELMADAMATYFATHKKGLSLNAKRVTDALLSFYTVGDCVFDSPGHHGTPLQRQRAADWGADLAAAARPRSYVLPAADVIALFEKALPGIISGS
jgi:hypothetical protein